MQTSLPPLSSLALLSAEFFLSVLSVGGVAQGFPLSLSYPKGASALALARGKPCHAKSIE